MLATLASPDPPAEHGKPQAARASRSLSVPDPPGFSEFWREYPRKVGKIDAKRAYAKAIRNGASAGAILTALRQQVAAGFGVDEHFTVYPEGWLNAGRWLDEPRTPMDDIDALARAMEGQAGRPADDWGGIRTIDGEIVH